MTGVLDQVFSEQPALADDNSQAMDDAQQAYALAGMDNTGPVYRDVEPGGGGALSAAAKNAMDTADAMRHSVSQGYAGIEAQQQKQANALRDAIRTARERLLARPPSTSQVWFNIAKALGTPTQTGGFGEGLGNVSGALGEGAQYLQKEREQRENALGAYDTQLAQYGNEPDAIDNNLLKTKLDYLRLQMQQAGALDVAATRNGGRSGGVNTSPIAKLAAEESDPSLSPEQRDAAHRMKEKMLRPPRDPNAAVPLTPDDLKVADRVAKYGMSPQMAMSRIGSEKRVAFFNAVLDANPKWNDVNWKPFQQAMDEMASSKVQNSGGRLAAWGALLPHMELMQDLTAALQNGDATWINRAKNAVGNAFGKPAPSSLKTAVELWAPEIERAISSAQGSAEDRAQLKSLMDGSRNLKSTAAQIAVMRQMVGSKVDNILSGFYGEIPPEIRDEYAGFAEKKLSKESRRLIKKYNMLPDYLWDQGDLGTPTGKTPPGGKAAATKGSVPFFSPVVGAAPAAATPTGAKVQGVSPKAASYLD
jgi:hypothetical protein